MKGKLPLRSLPPPDPAARPWRRVLGAVLLVAAALLLAELLGGVITTPTHEFVDINF
jgi:hypothetical protein